MKNYISVLLILACFSKGFGQDSTYPVPPKPEGHLFYLQHSRNKNTVMYSVNLKNGKPDPEKPVKIYWIRYSEHGQEQNLNSLQRNYAYGLHSVALGDGSYELNFVSDKKFKINLRQGTDGYHIYTTINQQPAILSKLFLEINGGGLLSPNIEYVQLSGSDVNSGQPLFQRVKIK